jgi:hypothetical protein
LHHIANEYQTDWAGEAEIAAWEIASGCGRHGWAWVLNLGAFTVGMVLFPKRLYRAFMRGRQATTNLYHEGLAESELRTKTVQWLRDGLGVRREDWPIPSSSDRFAFAFWCVIGVIYHGAWVVFGLATAWWIVTWFRA